MATKPHEVSIPTGYETYLSIKCKWANLANGDSGEWVALGWLPNSSSSANG